MRSLKVFGLMLIVCLVGIILLMKMEFVDDADISSSVPVERVDGLSIETHEPSIAVQREVSLFSGSAVADIQWTSRTPAAKRIQKIFPDTSWMTPEPTLTPGDMIHLDLFDDVSVDAEISRVTCYPNGAVGITAQLLDENKGTVYLSYCDGELRASIEVLGGDDFYIRYNGETASHYAIEVDRKNSDYQEGGEPKVPNEALRELLVESAEADETTLNDPVPVVEADPEALAAPPAGLSEDTVVIDVMVVYTPAALSAEGGLSGININIAMAMEKANEAHTNSDTRVYLNLVHSAEVTYTESGDAGLDLDRLTFAGSPYSQMDIVHTWRDTYEADLICLFESNPGGGGLGWRLSSETGRPDYGFCLARVQQTEWTYTAVHEWAHNMGCSHSKTQANGPWESDDLFTYSAGWQWADTASSASIGYCSIMTYENFDGNSGNGNEYEEVPYFSNPTINYTGDSTNPTGHAADGDNARCIRNTRYAIADYRINPLPVSEFPYSNSFETNFSEWVYYEGTASWERQDGSDVNLQSNAPNIATTNAADGSIYLYIDGLEYQAGQTAYLRAVFDFSSLSSVGMDFSYVMYSAWGIDGSNSLEVSTNSGSAWTTLWSNSGESDNNWRQESVNLDAYAGLTNVYLRFKADLSANWVKNYYCLDAISVTGQVAETSNDIDEDGLPNDWELEYFGSETAADPLAIASNGVNTLLEAYIAGFNPTNSGAFFEAGLTNGYEVWWSATSGRVYAVWSTTNLLDGFSVETNILWPQASWTDQVERAMNFYRVEVTLP